MSNSPMSEVERIAKLEVAQQNNDDDIDEFKRTITHMRDTLDIINLRMARMGGFVAGVAFVFGLIGTGFALLLEMFFNRHT